MSARLVCARCRAEEPLGSLRPACACGGLLEVEHAPARLERAAFDGERPSGVWRWKALVDPDLPAGAVVSLEEGSAPLLAARAVTRWCGLERLLLAHEGRNPTGSFKDRGMTVAVSRARESGARAVACASTGNTAASLAAYAAAAGLPAVALAPDGAVAPAKIAQALAHGARVLLVRGDFDQALALARALADEGELALLNSVSPWRLEGQKTIVFDVLRRLGWRAPDWIAFPAGNLGNCAAFGKALREARAAGLIDRLPRLLAVQASGAAPFASAFARGFDRLVPVVADTVATAIRIGSPASYERAVRAIRATSGVVTSVPDASILEAKAVVDRAGIGAEPASCAAVAGVRALAARGEIRPGDTVACVLTGHLLKDVDALRPARGPERVEPTLDALRLALEGAR